MSEIDRRHFLQNSAALAASLSAFEIAATAGARAASPDDAPADGGKKVGPNDQIRVAVIGVKGRGMEHVASYLKLKDAKITTICDVDRRVIGPGQQAHQVEGWLRAEVRSGSPPGV